MAIGNVSYEQTIGLMTAMTEITRSGTKAARGLTSIQSRYNQIVDESSSTGKKLTNWYKEHGIQVKDSEGQLISFFDVAKQVSAQWDTLSENEKRYYLNTQAGANQSQNLGALMMNFSTAIDATATAMDSAGSAARENTKYLDSVQGHLQSLQSAWESLSNHLLDSDTLKGIIDIGTSIINVVDNIVSVLDQLPGKLGSIILLVGTLGTLISAKKLFNIATGITGIGNAIGTVGTQAKSASPLFSFITKELTTWINTGSILATNLPLIAGAITALGVALAAIEFDKYFSFDSSLKRLNEYKDNLSQVSDEITALEEKRGSEGLTDAEKTHLAVLEAEERSLQRQIELEQQRVKKAFQRDATSSKGGAYQERTGPTQLLEFNDALKEQVELSQKISEIRGNIEYWKGIPDGLITQEQVELLKRAEEELQGYEEEWTEVSAKTAEAGSELASYWEEIKNSVPYDELDAKQKEVFNNVHEAFLQNQIDASILTDSYADVSNALSNMVDSLGFEGFGGLIDFDNIDISKLKSVEDVVTAVKEKFDSLDDEAEIKFEAKDETGEVIGKIEGKKGDLDGAEWETILEAQATGDWSKVEELKKQKGKDSKLTQVVDVKVNKKESDTAKKEASKEIKTPVKFKAEGTSTINSYRTKYGKDITATVNFKLGSTPKIPGFAEGKRKGELVGGMAWLGDEGTRSKPKPELVVGKDGAYLAGTNGWELYPVKASDTVYSYADTKKLLGNSTGFNLIDDGEEFPRFKKGKKKSSSKKSSKSKKSKTSAKTKKKKQAAYDNELKQLEHYRNVYHWDDATYQAQRTALYNKYAKYLTGDQINDYTEDTDDYYDNLAKQESERLVGLVSAGAMSSASAVASINANGHLTADEKKDYKAKAYQASVTYNLKEYQNGKQTREQILTDIKNYYNTRGQYDEEYYKMLDDLREADKKKEVDRLNELAEKEENKLSYLKKYAERQKDYYDKQIDKEKEEAEELEKLVDLQEKLNNAKQTMVRVYREGVGFVYEQDTKAVREAQKALDDYNKEHQKSELEKKADEWQNIIDLMNELEDLSDMKELELLLGIGGITDITGGDIGTDIGKWTELIKGIISAQTGYKDIASVLNKATGADIEALIGATLTSGDKTISDTMLAEYFAKHSFASGTLNSPSGFSIIGERGYELGWLNKGSTILPHSISRNLLELGKYAPAKILSNALNGAKTQVFNFDKIVLPNVNNADEFYKELKALPNKALQQSTLRA